MMQENNFQLFRSKDFFESAIILTAGIPLIDIEPGSGKFMTFVFDDKNFQAEDIIEKHWSGELKQPTKDLIRNIIELKQRIFSRKARGI